MSSGQRVVLKHLREALRLLGEEWTLDGRAAGGNYRLRHLPTGVVSYIASSPSDRNAVPQAVRQARQRVAQALAGGRRA